MIRSGQTEVLVLGLVRLSVFSCITRIRPRFLRLYPSDNVCCLFWGVVRTGMLNETIEGKS